MKNHTTEVNMWVTFDFSCSADNRYLKWYLSSTLVWTKAKPTPVVSCALFGVNQILAYQYRKL